MSQSSQPSAATDSEKRGLPMVVPQLAAHEGWLARITRILFGWKAAATRADLELVHTADQPQSGWLNLDLAALDVDADQSFQVHDLLSEQRFIWRGARNYVLLDPRARQEA